MIKNKKLAISLFIFFVILILYILYNCCLNNQENFFNWSGKKDKKDDKVENESNKKSEDKYIYIIDNSKNNTLVSYNFRNKEDKIYMNIIGEWDYMSETIYCNVKNIKNNIISKIRHIGYAQYHFTINNIPVTVESRKTKRKFLKININNFDEVIYFKKNNDNIIIYTIHSGNIGNIDKVNLNENIKYKLLINKNFKKYINIIALSFIIHNQLEKERKQK